MVNTAGVRVTLDVGDVEDTVIMWQRAIAQHVVLAGVRELDVIVGRIKKLIECELSSILQVKNKISPEKS